MYLAAVLAAMGFAAPSPAQTVSTFSGRCVGVTDGDSINVMQGGVSLRVRLDGIDAPEPGQPFAQKSKQALSDLVFGKDVLVAGREFDDYGRLVARVYAGSQDTSLALVLGGWAWHFKRHSSDEALAQGEIAARAAKLGLWADPSPTTPWDFRSSVATPRAGTPAPLGLMQSAEATEGGFRGNTSSKVYHSSNCRNFTCQNCTAVFSTAAAAEAAGFRPSGDCVGRGQVTQRAAPRQATSSGAIYHGNRSSRVFHRSSCQHFYCKNCTAVFSSRDEAIAAGYRPGGCCHP